jgi:hypothetical protein
MVFVRVCCSVNVNAANGSKRAETRPAPTNEADLSFFDVGGDGFGRS